MKKIPMVLLLLHYLNICNAETFEYKSVSFSANAKLNISTSTLVIDTEFELVSCEEQKSIFKVEKCVKPYPVIRYSDTIKALSICEESKEHMICALAENFNFSLPLDNRLQLGKWSFKGVEYTIVSRDFQLSIWGELRKNIIVVHAINPKGNESLYFYSKEYGLLGFRYLIQGNNFYSDRAYFLSSDRGYGITRKHNCSRQNRRSKNKKE